MKTKLVLILYFLVVSCSMIFSQNIFGKWVYIEDLNGGSSEAVLDFKKPNLASITYIVHWDVEGISANIGIETPGTFIIEENRIKLNFDLSKKILKKTPIKFPTNLNQDKKKAVTSYFDQLSQKALEGLTPRLESMNRTSGYFEVNINTLCFDNTTYFDRISSKNVEPSKNVTHDFVDLGLPSGVMWATCNLGASTMEEYGGFYSWGETDGFKYTYTQSNYAHKTDAWDEVTGGGVDADGFSIPKRTIHHDFEYKNLGEDISGTIYDAARQLWGNEWRIPSSEEWAELKQYCRIENVVRNNVKGYKITSTINNNWIFLPKTGMKEKSHIDYEYIYYRSTKKGYAIGNNLNEISSDRYNGLPIRPVFTDQVQKEKNRLAEEEKLKAEEAKKLAEKEARDAKMQLRKDTLKNRMELDLEMDHSIEYIYGGNAGFLKYVAENMIYPPFAAENGIQGRVSVTFVINEDGSISDIEELSSPAEDLTKEAKRLLLGSEYRWIPARKEGKYIRTKNLFPLTFRLH